MATLSFVHRFQLTLPHYHNVDLLKITAENGLDRVEKWIKVRLIPMPCILAYARFLVRFHAHCLLSRLCIGGVLLHVAFEHV